MGSLQRWLNTASTEDLQAYLHATKQAAEMLTTTDVHAAAPSVHGVDPSGGEHSLELTRDDAELTSWITERAEVADSSVVGQLAVCAAGVAPEGQRDDLSDWLQAAPTE